MIHPSTELKFISEAVGYGVVASCLIPCGTVIWVMDKLDRTFSPAKVGRMLPELRDSLDHFCYRNKKGEYVLCWDHARFVNHSFNPNCIATAYNFELAVRDINIGEELTDDYGFLNILESFRSCDEGFPRKIVHPDDLKRHYRQWDKKLISAFRRFGVVDQPLRPLMPASVWRKGLQISEGKSEMDSILNNLCMDQR